VIVLNSPERPGIQHYQYDRASTENQGFSSRLFTTPGCTLPVFGLVEKSRRILVPSTGSVLLHRVWTRPGTVVLPQFPCCSISEHIFKATEPGFVAPEHEKCGRAIVAGQLQISTRPEYTPMPAESPSAFTLRLGARLEPPPFAPETLAA